MATRIVCCAIDNLPKGRGTYWEMEVFEKASVSPVNGSGECSTGALFNV